MKELKMAIWSNLSKGVAEVNHLLQAYTIYLEGLNGKNESEEIEDFVDAQMSSLRSICDSHLSKIQRKLVEDVLEWKKKKEAKKEIA